MTDYQNLIEVLMDRRHSNCGITFINRYGEEKFILYYKLYQKALQILYGLQIRGITSNNELIIQLDNIEFFIYTIWASFLGNIIPVPVAVGYNDEHRFKLSKICDRLNNPYIILTKNDFIKIKDFAEKHQLNNLLDVLRYRTFFYEELDKEQNYGEIQKVKNENIAFIQFSSGSTGDPKGVILTHKNLITNIKAIINKGEVTDKDSSLSWMPLTHDMGLIGLHLSPLFKGINQYLMPTSLFIRNPLLWLQKASEHRTSILASPNFGYKYYLTWYKRKKENNLDLSCVRLIFNGAEPISVSICNEFLNEMSKYGLKQNVMFPVYGLAEASLAVTFPPVGEKIKSIKIDRDSLGIGKKIKIITDINNKNAIEFVDLGYPINDCYIRITDENNKQLQENFVGYVQIKGDNVTSGYYNNKEETEKIFTSDGWLNTGDLGFIRNERLILTGRAKEIIFVNGQNYYPHDLERIAEEIDGIELGKIAFCSSYNKDLQKEQILAFIFFKKKIEEFIPIIKKLKEHILNKIGLEIDEIIPVNSIPKTTSGKIQRYKLVKLYEEGFFNDIISKINIIYKKEKKGKNIDLPKTELEKQLLNICKEVLRDEKIGINDNLLECGGNSILLTQIHEKIDKLYPGKLKITDFFEFPTISKLAKLLQNKSTLIIKGIEFPQEYFGFNNTHLIFSYTLSSDIFDRLSIIADEESVEITDILLSAFIFLLKEITNKIEINVEVLIDFKKLFTSLKIDFSQNFSNFGSYFRVINNKLKDKNNYLYSFNDLEKSNFIKKIPIIIPLFYKNKSLKNNKNLLDYFDLVLEYSIENKNINLSLKYNGKQLKNKKMKEFLENYVRCIHLFIDNYFEGEAV